MSRLRGLRGCVAAVATVGLLGAGGAGSQAVTPDGGPSSAEEAPASAESVQVIVDSNGNMSAIGDRRSRSAKAVPDCVGHYKPGNAPCQAGQVGGGAYKTHKGCENQGRWLMANVHEPAGNDRIGYYTWGCTEVTGGYLLALAGFVKVFDTNATHSYWG